MEGVRIPIDTPRSSARATSRVAGIGQLLVFIALLGVLLLRSNKPTLDVVSEF